VATNEAADYREPTVAVKVSHLKELLANSKGKDIGKAEDGETPALVYYARRALYAEKRQEADRELGLLT
jgi:hypothetical protein